MREKGFAILLVLILVLLGAAGTIGLIQFLKSKASPPFLGDDIKVIDKFSPTPNPQGGTTNWKVYKAIDDAGKPFFEIQYPPDWGLEGPKPRNYNVHQPLCAIDVYIFKEHLGTDYVLHVPLIRICVNAAYIQSLDEIRAKPGQSGPEKVKFAGRDALKFITDKPGYESSIEYVSVKPGTVYRISISKVGAEDQSLVDQILSTFKFLD